MRRATAGLVAAALVFTLGGTTGAATHATATPNAKLQRLVRGLVRAGAPGALVVVRTPTGTRRAASGVADRSQKRPLRVTDRYRIASVTKAFVATVTLQLVAERRLALADSVERWLPGLVPNGQSITIRQLLNHTSGLFDYGADADWEAARLADPGRTWSPRELVAIATAHEPLFAPGTSWAYSNTNYVLLGLAVEAATGRPLADELQTRVFDRLALRSTSYPTGAAIPGRYAHGYVVSRPPLPTPPGMLIDVSTILNPSAWGAGQMVSNADDLTRFITALARGRLLPAAQLRAMKTAARGSAGAYGLGLGLVTSRCGRAIGHDGDIAGYRNVVLGTVDGRRAVAIMINIDLRVSWARLHEAAFTALCSG